MGAWIETRGKRDTIRDVPGSHPVWVRGLKLKTLLNYTETGNVAPRVGAWIETKPKRKAQAHCKVAPRVGAWIETPGNG